MTSNKKIVIFGGGTVSHVSPHLALCAPAFGKVARNIADIAYSHLTKMNRTLNIELALTKMADPINSDIITTEDLRAKAIEVTLDLSTKIVFMTSAICDFEVDTISSKDHDTNGRLESSNSYDLSIKRSEKILPIFRKTRKDIFLIAFSATYDKSYNEMYRKAIRVLKNSSCNLVLANDIKRNTNFIVTPEESVYSHFDRRAVLSTLVEMALLRSNLTFTQSTVVDGQPEPWNSPRIPDVLRTVVEYCIKQGAYKPVLGKTAGHFACKLSDTEFLTSIRKTNFNDLPKLGLVYVKTDGPDTVMAYGAKPSVGGQSQRIIFKDHPGFDCIVHFHCPIKKPYMSMPTASQMEFECGSHECGKNTSDHLGIFIEGSTKIKAVNLTKHGPNIVFSKDADPQDVINFIDRHFDLSKKTGPVWDT